ncbi:ATP-binding protein [Faucicola boevrei]|uniref:ATP-binding protein n=1 Tax=Faucicola boevrei TaxID=346665 RepID=UPI0003814245|nr:ATP-binding protein [Moraxella boevrei]
MSNTNSSLLGDLFSNAKYRPLLISLLALTAFLIALGVANYTFAQRATTSTEHMDLIGNISDNTLFIATGTQQLERLISTNPAKGQEALNALKTQSAEIDSYLEELFTYEQKETAMQDFGVLWKNYSAKINTLTPNSSPAQFADLANYAYQQQAPIWDYMNVGYDTYLEDSLAMASYTRYIQIIALVTLIGFLVFFVGYALRRMRLGDALVEKAQKETDEIMHTVNEGLFLIDKDLKIGEQYSSKLEDILQQRNIAGRNLYDLLGGMISQKDMETTKLFVEQLYNTWVVEELIQDLNPLKQVLISFVDKDGMSDTKFLEFNFLRVMDKAGKAVEKVFVSVVDVTKEVRLQLQMQKDREQHDRQIDMISYLLTVNPTQLNNFITETKQRIERMNNVLKTENLDNLPHKAQQLYRESHRLKGDASAIKLNTVVSITEKQENHVKQLLEKQQLTGNDFLGFTIALNELIDMVKFIEGLTQRLNLKDENVVATNTAQPTPKTASVTILSHNKPTATPAESNYWQNYFSNYASDIAKRQGKKVVVSVNGFDDAPMSAEKSHLYKDIATQFLKNAIVHGIENPSERVAKGKPETGVVTLNLENVKNNQQKLSVTDDGQGINWAKIRDKAVEIGQVKPEQAQNLQPRDLVRLMLSAGVSTADKQDEDAGRGVGMDIVRQLAVEGQGKFGVNSQPNQFTQMTVTFPR